MAPAWQPDAARDRSFAQELRVTGIFVDGTEQPTADRLVFMPDGLGIPFRVALEARGLAWAVEGDAAGAVTMVER